MKIKHLPFLFFAFAYLNGLSQCVQISTEPEAGIFCPNDEIILTATPGYESYNWYYNFQNSTEDGTLFETGDNSITLNAAEWAVSYWYVIVDDEICTDPSPTVVWDSWVFAPVAISHDFPTAFCPGDSSLIENAFNGPVNFQWYQDFSPIEGATESSYWVTEPGYYTLQAAYPECPNYWLNSGLGPDFSLYTPQIPEIALEMFEGTSQLSVEGITGIQWYFEDQPIEGATEASLIPEEDGVYTVSGTDENGCEVVSEPFLFTSLSAREEMVASIAVVYPNPARDEVSVSLKEETIQTVHIYDATGKLVMTPELIASEDLVRFNIDQLIPGSYLLHLITVNNKTASSHIVITE
jgi:hypothetical protein